MSNRQVAEVWANSSNAGGHSLNMFFEHDTIYSYGYHFPIARKLDREYNGQKVALFTTRGYSNTTSKHKSEVSRALHGAGYLLVMVHNVETNAKETLLTDIDTQVVDLIKKLDRVRSDSNRVYYARELEQVSNNRLVIGSIF